MKKLLSILAAGAMLTAAVPFSASADNYVKLTDEQFNASDFNSDGNVDLIDAVYLLERLTEVQTGRNSYIAIMDEAGREYIDKTADYNDDGIVDVRDASNFAAALIERNIEYVIDENVYSEMCKKVQSVKEAGDINQDDVTDARDASILLSYYADSQVSNPIVDADEVSAYFNGDVTGDGTVDARDASAVLDIYAKNATK